MTIERIFYCDAPDPDNRDEGKCMRHVRTASVRPHGAGFLFVTGFGKPLHFCSWDCVLKFAAAQPPVEVIPFHDGDAA